MDHSTNRGCLSSRGAPLRSFTSRASAEETAAYVLETHGRRTVPYSCKRCRRWHLCPAERYTPNRPCDACGKKAYETEEGASRRARLIERERGTSLRVYLCPYGSGWHLTSKL